MPRPTLVCHMITSLDGRLLPQRWPVDGGTLMTLYEGTADRIGAGGWIVGRRTMEEYLPAGDPTAVGPPLPRDDRLADRGAGGLAICVDRRGCLRPDAGRIDGDHLVLVVSDRVAPAHVDALAAAGVSVIFAGPDGDDLAGALDRIGAAFGVDRLLLEGGGTINGALLDADLVDETSTLVFPVIDGAGAVPAIYDRRRGPPRSLTLLSAEPLEDGTVWLRHRVLRD